MLNNSAKATKYSGVLKISFIVGGLIRHSLLQSSYQPTFSERRELSSPLNEWKRIKEAVYLIQEGIDPYIGDRIHELPLHLHLYSMMITYAECWIPLLMVLMDLGAAWFLYLASKYYQVMALKREEKLCMQAGAVPADDDGDEERNKTSVTMRSRSGKFLNDCTATMKIEDVDLIPAYVAMAYLFNPYSLLNCAAMTTTVFDNFYLALALYGIFSMNVMVAPLALAICATKSMYPTLLLVGCLMVLYRENQAELIYRTVRSAVFFSALILYLSYMIHGGWSWMSNVYGFIFRMDGIDPNIGLYWYLFAELFNHFRGMFLYTLQLNSTIMHLAPLAIHFRNDPSFFVIIQLCLNLVYKSYPSLGDTGLVLSFALCTMRCFPFMRHGVEGLATLVISSLFLPICSNVWLQSNAGNANYYFGNTLVLGAAQSVLLVELVGAFIKRRYKLYYLTKGIDLDMEPVLLL